MKFHNCYLAAIFGACFLHFAVVPAAAQRPTTGSPSAGSAGAAGTAGTSSTLGNSPTNRNTTLNNTNNASGIDQSRPIFLSGNVMFDDGTPPNIDVRIERVCRGNPHVESHSDSRGNFSFQVGSPVAADMSAFDASSGSGTSKSSNPFGGVGSSSSTGSSNLFDCELRASYPGYVSEVIELGSRRSLDDPNVGTIVLHRLANVKGTTISLTSAMAPKSALKSFQKGMLLAQKGKFDEAQAKFQDATQEYPKYAEAWFERGQVEEKLNRVPDATTSYLAAMKADAKYVSPYDRLARLSAEQSKWEDTEKYSKQAIDLNPVEFPTSFWYNAIANYNLKNDAAAEKSARSLVKLDRRHRFPEAERLLADMASNRGDLNDAAAHLKTYLEIAPNAQNAEQSRNLLARIEAAQAAQAKNSAAPAVAAPPQ